MFAFKDSNGRAPTYLAGLLHLRTPQRCMLLCFTGKNFGFDFINKVGLDVCKLQRQLTSGSVYICTRVTALYCKLCTHKRNVFSWITSVSAALSVSQSEL